MPGHMKAKKDVVSCDKLRGGANSLRSGDFRMGQPLSNEILKRRQTLGTETSKYQKE